VSSLRSLFSDVDDAVFGASGTESPAGESSLVVGAGAGAVVGGVEEGVSDDDDDPGAGLDSKDEFGRGLLALVFEETVLVLFGKEADVN
jgi:hypothetical protein